MDLAGAAPGWYEAGCFNPGGPIMLPDDIVNFVYGRPAWQIALYLVAVNLITFLTYGWDKLAAMERGWRVSEGMLHLLGLIGGTPGAFLAQQLFRHKTRKQPFRTIFWLMVICQILAGGWLVLRGSGYI